MNIGEPMGAYQLGWEAVEAAIRSGSAWAIDRRIVPAPGDRLTYAAAFFMGRNAALNAHGIGWGPQ